MAGIIATLATNPIGVARTRLQVSARPPPVAPACCEGL